MAKIVLGLGTSHSPLLVLKGAEWEIRAGDDRAGRVPLHTLDGKRISYEELAKLTGERYRDVATPERFRADSEAAERALDKMADTLAEANPDVVVIVGDDQGELYDADNIPAFSVYHGDTFVMRPYHSTPLSLPWADAAFWRGYSRDLPHRFPGSPALAIDIVKHLIESGVDVATSNACPDPDRHGFGHAIGFVVQRLFKGKTIPVIPVLLNTYFPPNTPTPRRCFEIGQKLREAIEASGTDLRVAIVASGGLSHFICEEAFDHDILRALRSHDGRWLASIPAAGLLYGSSEIRNWILAAGAIPHLPHRWDTYIPVRRTAAGSGIGLAFMAWH